MTAERIPAEVWPLASFIYEEMKTRGWRTEDVIAHSGLTDEMEAAKQLIALDLLMVVHEDKLLTGDSQYAVLSNAFGVSEEYLRRLDATWRLYPESRTPWECPDDAFGPISRRAFIRPVPETNN